VWSWFNKKKKKEKKEMGKWYIYAWRKNMEVGRRKERVTYMEE
jgi:hypothetical protein